MAAPMNRRELITRVGAVALMPTAALLPSSIAAAAVEQPRLMTLRERLMRGTLGRPPFSRMHRALVRHVINNVPSCEICVYLDGEGLVTGVSVSDEFDPEAEAERIKTIRPTHEFIYTETFRDEKRVGVTFYRRNAFFKEWAGTTWTENGLIKTDCRGACGLPPAPSVFDAI